MILCRNCGIIVAIDPDFVAIEHVVCRGMNLISLSALSEIPDELQKIIE